MTSPEPHGVDATDSCPIGRFNRPVAVATSQRPRLPESPPTRRQGRARARLRPLRPERSGVTLGRLAPDCIRCIGVRLAAMGCGQLRGSGRTRGARIRRRHCHRCVADHGPLDESPSGAHHPRVVFAHEAPLPAPDDGTSSTARCCSNSRLRALVGFNSPKSPSWSWRAFHFDKQARDAPASAGTRAIGRD